MSAQTKRLDITRPSMAKTKATRLDGEGIIRLCLEVQPQTRQVLKIRAAQEGITLRSYLLGLAVKDGNEIVEPLE